MLSLSIGTILVILAALAADRLEIRDLLKTDLSGKTISGTIEKHGSWWRVTYHHPSGSIYTRNWHTLPGNISPGAEQSHSIRLRYNPRSPEQFQPLGASIKPALATLFLFLCGMVLVLRARHLMRMMRNLAYRGSNKTNTSEK